MPKKRSNFDHRQQLQKNRVNHQIRFSPLLVIGADGDKLGIISREEAMQKAKDAGLDLVEVAPLARPPVCRIMDYGKFKYQQSVKEKKQKQNGSQMKLKVVRLSPVTDSHDIETKAGQIRKFLESGNSVQLKLQYKGRQKAHKDIGFDIIDKVLEAIKDVGSCHKRPKLQGGSFLECIIDPNKE